MIPQPVTGRGGRAGGRGESRVMDLIFFSLGEGGPLAHSHLLWLQLLWGEAALLPSAEWQSLPGFARCCSICWRQHFCLWGARSLPPAPALKSLLLCIHVWRSPSLLREQGLPGCSYLLGTCPRYLPRPPDVFVHFHVLYNVRGWVLFKPGFREITSHSAIVCWC